MTREQGKSKSEVAPHGVFHLQLDRDVPSQMIRIALPAGTDIYPKSAAATTAAACASSSGRTPAPGRSRHRGRALHADDLYLTLANAA